MKEPLKYKIWDKENSCWYEPTFEAYKGKLHDLTLTPAGELIARNMSGSVHESSFPDQYEVVRFTGRKDKNETEIYNGDLIDSYQNDHLPTEVYWDEQLTQYSTTNYHSTLSLCDSMNNDTVILGNKYENPELLK